MIETIGINYGQFQFRTNVMGSLAGLSFDSLKNIFVGEKFYNGDECKEQGIIIHADLSSKKDMKLLYNFQKQPKYKRIPKNLQILYNPVLKSSIPVSFYCDIMDVKNNIGAVASSNEGSNFYRLIDLKTGKWLTGDDEKKVTGVFNLFPETSMVETYNGKIARYFIKDESFFIDESTENREYNPLLRVLGVYKEPRREFFEFCGKQYLNDVKNYEKSVMNGAVCLSNATKFEKIWPDYQLGMVKEESGFKLRSFKDGAVVGNSDFSFDNFVYSNGYFTILKDSKIHISSIKKKDIEQQQIAQATFKFDDENRAAYLKNQCYATEMGFELRKYIKSVRNDQR